MEKLRDRVAVRSMLSSRAGFPIGTAETIGHYHLHSEEVYVVEQGSAEITTWPYAEPNARASFLVNVGDCVIIPPEYAHQVLVNSSIDFVCLVFASPPFSFWDQFFL